MSALSQRRFDILMVAAGKDVMSGVGKKKGAQMDAFDRRFKHCKAEITGF